MSKGTMIKISGVTIFLVLLLLSGLCSCMTPTRPDTEQVRTEAKAAVKKAEATQKRIQDKQAKPLEVDETIDALKASVEDLLVKLDDSDAYADTLETRIKDIENSFRYEAGGYVLYGGVALGVLIMLFVALKIYASGATPVAWVVSLFK